MKGVGLPVDWKSWVKGWPLHGFATFPQMLPVPPRSMCTFSQPFRLQAGISSLLPSSAATSYRGTSVAFFPDPTASPADPDMHLCCLHLPQSGCSWGRLLYHLASHGRHSVDIHQMVQSTC